MADIETSVAVAPTTAVMMGEDPKPKAATSTGEATSAEIGASSVTTKTGLGHQQEVDEEDLEQGSEVGGGEEEAGGSDEASEPEDLGDYDTSDETVARFDERYVTEGGTLDVRGSLSEEFWRNAKKGVDGLNPATYEYLKDRFGIDKDTVKDIEAAQKAEAARATESIYARAGGKERLMAAVEWGKGGGYTKAQRDRFNAIVNGNDPEAASDAIDALMSRYEKAAGRSAQPASRRPVRPARDVTTKATTRSAVEPYATREEWAKEFREAREQRAGDSRMAEIRRRLAASPWNRKD